MKKIFGVALAIALGVGGGAFLARAQDQQPPAPAPPPVKPGPWEYKVFLMDYSEYSEKDDWKEFKERSGGNELKADAEFRTYVLNYLAREGWELEQVVQLKEKLGFFYLRRPRRADAPPASSEQAPDDSKNLPDGDPHRRRPTPH